MQYMQQAAWTTFHWTTEGPFLPSLHKSVAQHHHELTSSPFPLVTLNGAGNRNHLPMLYNLEKSRKGDATFLTVTFDFKCEAIKQEDCRGFIFDCHIIICWPKHHVLRNANNAISECCCIVSVQSSITALTISKKASLLYGYDGIN